MQKLKLPIASKPELTEVMSLKTNVVNEKMQMLRTMEYPSGKRSARDLLSRLNKMSNFDKNNEGIS